MSKGSTMKLPEPDSAVTPRPGEAPDARPLARYLKSHLPLEEGGLEILQFPGGFSNLTFLLRSGGQEWVLRRPPPGARANSGHDMAREFRVLSALHPVFRRVPRPIHFCDDADVIGAHFYIMERMKGIILRGGHDSPITPSAAVMEHIATEFITVLAELHALDYRSAGLEQLGRPDGYTRRQVEGWADRYEKARTDDIAEMAAVAGWLAGHLPPERPHALIHNDYKYDNIVLSSEPAPTVLGVLDWEMATLGDPLMDLGTTLGYWVEQTDPPFMQQLALSPTMLPGNPARRELAESYAARTGSDLSHIVFYYSFGLFKIAVIIQQIYARYCSGATSDARFADLIHGVRGCAAMAHQAIRKKRIDHLFTEW